MFHVKRACRLDAGILRGTASWATLASTTRITEGPVAGWRVGNELRGPPGRVRVLNAWVG